MTMLDNIKNRRSVRTFDGSALRKEDEQKILDFAEKVENPYDIPVTWRILDADRYGLESSVITGTKLFIAGKLHRVPYAEEAFGYTFEKVILYAQSLGVGTTWIAGTMNRNAFERAMNVSDGEVMPCVSPLGYPAKKMSLRETMMRKGIRADSRLDFKELFFDGSFERPLTEDKAGNLLDVLKAVSLAPSAVNKQPWRVVVCGSKVHFFEKRSKGYVDNSGWDLQKVDMGISLSHFELAAWECGISVTFEICDPQIPGQEGLNYIASYII